MTGPRPKCCKCGTTPDYGMYENCQGDLFCMHCANGLCATTRVDGQGNVTRCPLDEGHTGDHFPKPSKQPDVPCVCGVQLIPMDDDAEYPMWMHRAPSTRCKTPVPAAGMPTESDRRDLELLLKQNADKLAEAGQAMKLMHQAMDSVDARMAALDAQLNSPAVVRRATLNEVWDLLMSKGHLGAAIDVMNLIRSADDL